MVRWLDGGRAENQRESEFSYPARRWDKLPPLSVWSYRRGAPRRRAFESRPRLLARPASHVESALPNGFWGPREAKKSRAL